MAFILKKPPETEKDGTDRENSQFIYSLILIFLIPAAIIFYSFWSFQKTQNNLKLELQKKAQLSMAIFSATTADSLENDALLQTKINEIIKNQREIQEITVLKPLADGFLVVASSKTANLGLTYQSLQYTTSWVENKPLNTTSLDKTQNPSQRYLVVISPLNDSRGEKVALASLKMNLAESDRQSQRTLLINLIVLGITVFFVLLLLFNHFRFFEYALLFKRLKEVDKMKDDFISMASHELKTPMAAIKGYMGMIFEGVAGKIDKKAKEHLEKVLANIKRLDALINALLDVSRIEQGRIQFDMQAIDITKTIEAIVSEIKIQADEKKLKLEYQPLPRPRPFIFADPERLAQVFDNVIGNALKYTFKGEVKIYHKVENNQLKTMVQDTGIGISREDLKGMFTKFYRVRTEKTADIPGTGLGLWITKQILTRMNGEISVISLENVGSTFIISFPLMKEK